MVEEHERAACAAQTRENFLRRTRYFDGISAHFGKHRMVWNGRGVRAFP